MSVPLAFGWHAVLFANWPVDARTVAKHIPDALSVQTHGGDAWLSVLPFVNVDTRLRGLPPSVGVDVPELNLRTYVTCDGEPGVYFFSLDAESALAVLGARITHRLPYYYARMCVENADAFGRLSDGISFRSRRFQPGDRPARFDATYGPTGDRFEASSGSLAEFLTERRRLYTQGTDGAVRFTDVEHEPWPLYEADATIRTNTLFEANGFDHPESDPTLYVSPGVSATTTRSKRWRSQ